MVGKTVGKYRFIEKLGRGAMGTVYKAVDETLDREVAVKILNPELADTDVMKRFRAEASMLAKLNHPAIATIFELHRSDDDLLMVMEFVRGETLDQFVQRGGPLEPERAAYLLAQVLDAVGHAHTAGVIHRDLKPSNVMVTENGAAKDHGLRHRQSSRRRTYDDRRLHGGDAGLHVAGAGALSGSRRAVGPLFGRRHVLPIADRQAALPGRHGDRHGAETDLRCADTSPAPPRRTARVDARDSRPGARQIAGRPLSERRRIRKALLDAFKAALKRPTFLPAAGVIPAKGAGRVSDSPVDTSIATAVAPVAIAGSRCCADCRGRASRDACRRATTTGEAGGGGSAARDTFGGTGATPKRSLEQEKVARCSDGACGGRRDRGAPRRHRGMEAVARREPDDLRFGAAGSRRRITSGPRQTPTPEPPAAAAAPASPDPEPALPPATPAETKPAPARPINPADTGAPAVTATPRTARGGARESKPPDPVPPPAPVTAEPVAPAPAPAPPPREVAAPLAFTAKMLIRDGDKARERDATVRLAMVR